MAVFKELSESRMIFTRWASNTPYIIQVLKEGYQYDEYMKVKGDNMNEFEREIKALLERAKTIKKPINAAPLNIDIDEYNQPSEDWINDVEIFYNKYLKKHSLAGRIQSLLFYRSIDCFSQLVSCLKSISNDRDFINSLNGIEKKIVPQNRQMEFQSMMYFFHMQMLISKTLWMN